MRKLSATSKAGRQKNDLWGPSGTPLSVLRVKSTLYHKIPQIHLQAPTYDQFKTLEVKKTLLWLKVDGLVWVNLS